MELRHLRYFVAVASELNFSRAAKKLLVAQPSLSTQIAQLEADLGVQLLQRDRRSVQLTAAGAAFLEEARALLHQAEEARARAQQAARGESGRLSIGYFAASASGFLPDLVRRYRSRFPHVRILLAELSPERQLEAWDRAELDVSFTRPIPPGYSHLNSRVLFQERLLVAVAETHPLASRRTVRLAELAEEPFVLLERSEAAGLYDGLLAACRAAGFSPRIVSSPPLMSSVALLVAAEQGVSVVPEGVQNVRRHGLRYLPLRPSPPTIPLLMAWRDDADSPPAAAFRELVLERLPAIRRGFVE